MRDDPPRPVSCYPLALAIRDEALDLEKAGVRVIQIDEAAPREGLPLRGAQWSEYLKRACPTSTRRTSRRRITSSV